MKGLFLQPFNIDNFTLGWDNVSKPTTLNPASFSDIKNFNLTRHKGIEKRGGISLLHPTTAGASTDITTLYEYKAPNSTNYLLVATGTKIRSYFGAAWNDMKTGLTTGKNYDFVTHRGYCYGVNGVDDNFKLHNTTAYQVGIDTPINAPSAATTASGTDTVTSQYVTANRSYVGELRTANARTILAQSFKLDTDVDITTLSLWVKKVGAPTGNMWVEIHKSNTGTSATKNLSTNIVTASSASADVDISAFTTAVAEQAFTFATNPECSADTTYYMVIYSTHAVSDTNYVIVGFDSSSPTYTDGSYWEIANTLAWTEYSTVDLVFTIDGTMESEGELFSYGAVSTGDTYALRDNAQRTMLAQSFYNTTASRANSIRVAIREVGNIGTSTVWAEIHNSSTGTSGTKNDSDNIVGVATDSISKTSIGSDFSWVTLTFPSEITLAATTWYFLVLYTDGSVDADNYIEWTMETAAGFTSGSPYHINSAYTWSGVPGDFSFKIYGMATAAAEQELYSVNNIDDYRGLRTTAARQMIVQSFKAETTATVTKLVLYLSEVGTVAGGTPHIWCEIHDGQDGTSAAEDSSDRINGTKSADVDPTGLSAYPTYDAQTFTFSGTKPSLVAGTTYYIVLYGDYTVSATNFVRVQHDCLDPSYTDGSRWIISDAEKWTEKPGSDLIFGLYQTTGGIPGDYIYRYTYKRAAFNSFEGNPSEPCATVSPTAGYAVNVDVVASTDAQIDKILIYRTFNGLEDFYLLVELENVTQTYFDDKADDDLTLDLEYSHYMPPKATYIELHKDRIFYANCPDEDNGGSLVKWSKIGEGESISLTNYQYFDKDDGEDITGVASITDFFLVFKRNKIGVLAGDLESTAELWYLSKGIGCIAPWSIIPFGDKVIFLSEEGWKATDGSQIYSISDKINNVINEGYITKNEKDNYFGVYYPEKEQMHFLCNHSTLTPRVFIGHNLAPLLLTWQSIFGISEGSIGSMVGWTYHQYDYHTLTCLGTYTDDDGIQRVVAGNDGGLVYLLDSGTADESTNINVSLKTDWLTLGVPRSITKTIRKGYLTYSAGGTVDLTLTTAIDFESTSDTVSFTGGDVGTDDSINESFNMTGTGEVFRYTLTESGQESLGIYGFTTMFRLVGIR